MSHVESHHEGVAREVRRRDGQRRTLAFELPSARSASRPAKHKDLRASSGTTPTATGLRPHRHAQRRERGRLINRAWRRSRSRITTPTPPCPTLLTPTSSSCLRTRLPYREPEASGRQACWMFGRLPELIQPRSAKVLPVRPRRSRRVLPLDRYYIRATENHPLLPRLVGSCLPTAIRARPAARNGIDAEESTPRRGLRPSSRPRRLPRALRSEVSDRTGTSCRQRRRAVSNAPALRAISTRAQTRAGRARDSREPRGGRGRVHPRLRSPRILRYFRRAPTVLFNAGSTPEHESNDFYVMVNVFANSRSTACASARVAPDVFV